MALSAVRNVGPFLMIAAPALTSLIRIRRQSDGVQVERPLLNVTVMATAALAVAVTLAWAYVEPDSSTPLGAGPAGRPRGARAVPR